MRLLIVENLGLVATALVRRTDYEHQKTPMNTPEIDIRTLYPKVFITGLGFDWKVRGRQGREFKTVFEELTSMGRHVMNMSRYQTLIKASEQANNPDLDLAMNGLVVEAVTVHGPLSLEIPVRSLVQQVFALSLVPRAGQVS